ncbi:hypothetical protein BDF22DRAFT_667944 [Syncephalis plumigaleata]|nr:hypothetical protein BDF22DRAFT_667944 [Syncephalis plumigaleata]
MVTIRKRAYATQMDESDHEDNGYRKRRLSGTSRPIDQLSSNDSELIEDSTDIEHDKTQGVLESERLDINKEEEDNEDNDDNRLDLYLSDVHLAPESGSVDGEWRWWILTSTSMEDDRNNQNETVSQWTGETRSAPLSDEEYDQMIATSVDKPMVIRFRFGTDLQTVGEQVWTGALLLADYLIAYHTALFSKQQAATVLELGAGTGLCSILLHRLGVPYVFCTDGQQQVLRNCDYNVKYNQSDGTDNGGVFVRHLDWQHPPAWLSDDSSSNNIVESLEEFDWKESDIVRIRSDTQIFVAADVIYDNEATSAFLSMVNQLLKPSSMVKGNATRLFYVASEKRINFSLDELRVTAVAHDHFFRELRNYPNLQVDTDLPISTLPQRFAYTRNENLVLWRISWNDKCHGIASNI